MNNKRIASIVVDGIGLNNIFYYAIPDRFISIISIGSYVEIYFRGNPKHGFIVDILDYNEEIYNKYTTLLDIVNVDSNIPRISDKLIILSNIIAEYYCCSRFMILRAMLPRITRKDRNITWSNPKEIYISIKQQSLLNNYLFKNKNKISSKKKKTLEFILSKKTVSMEELCFNTDCSKVMINSLIKDDIISIKETDAVHTLTEQAQHIKSSGYKLNHDQIKAIKLIKSSINNNKEDTNSINPTTLIFGVTGSGKTEIYIQLIQLMIKQHKSTILLVPEVSLIYHIIDMLKPRINNDILSVLHYKLGDRIKYNEWIKIYKNDFSIVVGTRNALFAPCKKLGLIIIDEEHENTYKQDVTPRYHARDVAIMRANIDKCITVLGSATPSIESYYNAVIGKYNLITLKKRIDDKTMPAVKVIDMKDNKAIFSKELIYEIRQRIHNSEQVILFLNRRGFFTYALCTKCGNILKCENCSVNYTYHKKNKFLLCHMCGNIASTNITCSSCNSREIKYCGSGTERVEEIAASLFPNTRIRRMDSDTMLDTTTYETTMKDLKTNNIDILIGTQMLTKGLDLPSVTLVGILNADMELHITNFRSSERTFQLITQVIGRSGRGVINGEACVQTLFPYNDIIQYAISQDYESFFKQEIKTREQFYYPPKTNIIVLIVTSKNKEKCVEASVNITNRIINMKNDNIIISQKNYDDFIFQRQNNFVSYIPIRGSIDIEYKKKLVNVVREVNTRNVSVIIDVDSYLV